MHRIVQLLLAIGITLISGCSDDCSGYKELACENPNSELCHSAMQETHLLTTLQCREKIDMIETVRTIRQEEKESLQEEGSNRP